MAGQPSYEAVRLIAAQSVPVDTAVIILDVVPVVDGVEAHDAALEPLL